MSYNYLLERRRESRLSRFGMALGFFIALVFFALLFLFPIVKYEPILEKAKIRRVLVARPYRPRVLEPKKPGGGAKPKAQAQNRPKPKPKPQTPKKPPKPSGAPLPKKSRPPRPDKAMRPPPSKKRKASSVKDTPLEDKADEMEPSAQAEDLDALLIALEEKKSELEDLDDALGANSGVGEGLGGSGGGKGMGVGDGDGGYLDSLIRMNVVSYPKTSIEELYPEIDYPDLKFKRKQLQAGICRVYYRVWTDNSGRITRGQIKTPSTKEDLEKYAVFVDAVKSGVEEWVFDKVEAEIHIDVLFEIE